MQVRPCSSQPGSRGRAEEGAGCARSVLRVGRWEQESLGLTALPRLHRFCPSLPASFAPPAPIRPKFPLRAGLSAPPAEEPA